MLHKALTVPCQKSQIIFYDSSRIKSGVVSPVRFKFPVKSICCIASGSASSSYCFLKSIANFFKWNMINEVNNQLYSHLFDQYIYIYIYFFFEFCLFICWVLYVHMLLLNVWTNGFQPSIFHLYFWKKISCMSCSLRIFFKWWNLATPSKLGSCK